MQNDTVSDCPVADHPDKEFIVAVQNPRIRNSNGLIRVLLPSNKYTAQIWDRSRKQFTNTKYDIVEQKHFQNSEALGEGNVTTDYILFVQSEILPDELLLVKVVPT